MSCKPLTLFAGWSFVCCCVSIDLPIRRRFIFKTKLYVHCAYENVCIELLFKSVCAKGKQYFVRPKDEVFFSWKKIALRYFITAVAVCCIREANENKAHPGVPDLLSGATILPVPSVTFFVPLLLFTLNTVGIYFLSYTTFGSGVSGCHRANEVI